VSASVLSKEQLAASSGCYFGVYFDIAVSIAIEQLADIYSP
jgi:hypothetical protein